MTEYYRGAEVKEEPVSKIDVSKIKSLEDVKLILEILDIGIHNKELKEKVKHLLKD